VCDDDWQRALVLWAHVNEVDVDVVDFSHEVREGP
jgi:hypothetical protein